MKNSCTRKKYNISKIKLLLSQITLFIMLIIIWELLAHFNIINTFLFSKPSDIVSLMYDYFRTNEIYKHIYISLIETILGITIGSIVGIFIASLLWYSPKVSKLLNPFLVVLNALPKTALAPIMIIWAGTGITGIVVVAISILIIVTILSTYNCFNSIDEEKIKMMKSFNSTKLQIFTKLIFPANIKNIINIIKINIGLSWVGVIVGEFLVSRCGLGYLIMYGGQVFRLDLVMMGVIILAILALFMNSLIVLIEKLFNKRG